MSKCLYYIKIKPHNYLITLNGFIQYLRYALILEIKSTLVHGLISCVCLSLKEELVLNNVHYSVTYSESE